MSTKMRLYDMILRTGALGPGKRCAIWFQGCKKSCKGCMSPDSRPLQGGRCVSVDAVVNEVLKLDDIEGVTISGGEPFLQAEALYEMLDSIKKKTDLGVIIYTGYYLDELKKMKNEKVNKIITELSDLIIDGPYIDERNDSKSLRGSDNQGINLITQRYAKDVCKYGCDGRNIEIFQTDKGITVVGIPDKKTLEGIQNITKDL